MSDCNSCEPPTTPAVDTAPVDAPIDPSVAGVNKESIPDPRIHPADLPFPDGVSLTIPKIWMHSLVGSPFNSLTNPSEDEPVIRMSKSQLEAYGAGGQDLINMLFKALGLDKIKEKVSAVYAVAWDPDRFPTAPLLSQGDLPTGRKTWERRTEYLPDYIYMRDIGDHDLVIAAQLRIITQTGRILPSGDFNSWTEFPHIGPIVIRKIRIIMEA